MTFVSVRIEKISTDVQFVECRTKTYRIILHIQSLDNKSGQFLGEDI